MVPSSAHGFDDYYAYLLDGLAPGQHSAVSMLAVCEFAVTVQELEEIFPLPGMQIGAALTSVAPIVAEQPGIGGLKIHHESFSRFIRRVDGDDGRVDQVRSRAANWLSSGASSPILVPTGAYLVWGLSGQSSGVLHGPFGRSINVSVSREEFRNKRMHGQESADRPSEQRRAGSAGAGRAGRGN